MSKNCFHCLESVPAGFDAHVIIDNTAEPMCCIGCQAVAQNIIDQGMTDYYKYRTVSAGKVEQLVPEQLAFIKSYDNEDIQDEFISTHNNNSEVLLSVEGITCAACAWLIEKQLLNLKSVKRVDVNTSTNRAMIHWDKSATPLSELITSLAEIGYKAYPFQSDLEAQQKQQTAKAYIRRLGVAGLMTMQVMMFAFAMYFGMFSGMDSNFEQYFRWISLILATPVILYSALPFLSNAINGLKAKQLNMDLPVSLAIFGAYGASCYATVMEVGEVYFESICMFTFLLLLGKYLEFRARLKASEFTANLQKLLPLTARTLDERGNEHIIAAKKLKLNDIVLIKAGETIPADGILVKGSTSVDESMMTGEHQPVRKYIDHNVYAGTVNHDGIIEIKINKLGQNTLLNQIIRLQHNALTKRPRLVEITDKVAQWFVAVLLVFASITAIGWYQVDPDVAFWITISVLVATCPCALSLAIPTALTCAVATLTRKGILIKQAHVLETLSKLTLFAFDKTGTLTQGKFSLDVIDILDDNYSKEQILDIAAQLESYSEHPIASAFKEFKGQRKFDDVQLHPGIGISAQFDNTHYAIGKSGWFDTKKTNAQATLYINKQAVARFYFVDKVKADADKLINVLQAANLSCHMLTGDASDAGAKVAKKLKLDSVLASCSPKDKQNAVDHWSSQGEIVAMVGDGVNDSPVFASAHLSIAMETGADISKNSADVVLLNSDLASISHLLTIAKQTRRIIKQNLALSLLYNGSILPLAAMGLVAPWMAVIGMSASSIIVICNSLRLLKL
ncbi:cadmium-translocating P-type ATPase [Pseudoalteromonas sp. Scap03]|jgi:Cu2+-exporting ATPase|uniref:heavy metal translocating P-type ATPase n=1 Tax=unclassified Pseudoalteromonas TaxID=194690 RepID=UPI0015C0A1BA|nr:MULTISPECIES: heavy metal translocating P-type ATPase [unclassified Pseudoalteromonas]NWL16001.1 cadmium-translocating P-type ATPase [Pseudoalteromonas sp. Scap03]QLE81135.1 cadmium-translocating P-type ATPase [Pseudoalteromonas sp. Scap25]QLE89078.1 cadmium-translocating P-type ATPase [Pseudoalteromonas sp. Scap06]